MRNYEQIFASARAKADKIVARITGAGGENVKAAPDSGANFIKELNGIENADDRARFYEQHAHKFGFAPAPRQAALLGADEGPKSMGEFVVGMNKLGDPDERASYYSKYAPCFGL